MEGVSLFCAFVARRPLLFVGSVMVVSLLPLVVDLVVRATIDRHDSQAWVGYGPWSNALESTSVVLWLVAFWFLLLAVIRAIVRAARSRRAGLRLRGLDVQAGRAAIRLDEHARATETVLGRAHAVLPGQPELGVAIAALPLALINLLAAWGALGYASQCGPLQDCSYATTEGVVSATFAALLLGLAVVATWSWIAQRKTRVASIRWVAALEERVQRGEAPLPPAAPAAPRGPRGEVIRTSARRGATYVPDERRQP